MKTLPYFTQMMIFSLNTSFWTKKRCHLMTFSWRLESERTRGKSNHKYISRIPGLGQIFKWVFLSKAKVRSKNENDNFIFAHCFCFQKYCKQVRKCIKHVLCIQIQILLKWFLNYFPLPINRHTLYALGSPIFVKYAV